MIGLDDIDHSRPPMLTVFRALNVSCTGKSPNQSSFRAFQILQEDLQPPEVIAEAVEAVGELEAKVSSLALERFA